MPPQHHSHKRVQRKHLGRDVGEILQAGNLIVCDGRLQAGGEYGIDSGAEVGLDVSALWLGWGAHDPDHRRSSGFVPRS